MIPLMIPLMFPLMIPLMMVPLVMLSRAARVPCLSDSVRHPCGRVVPGYDEYAADGLVVSAVTLVVLWCANPGAAGSCRGYGLSATHCGSGTPSGRRSRLHRNVCCRLTDTRLVWRM